MMRPYMARRQRGTALLISLVLLVVLTLLAVTSIRTSSLNLRIAQNMQLQQEAEAAAQAMVEHVLSDIHWFNNPDDDVVIAGGIPGYDAFYVFDVDERRCLDSAPRPGDQLDQGADFTDSGTGGSGVTPGVDITIWDVRATATEGTSEARATIRQGVLIPMLAGSCP